MREELTRERLHRLMEALARSAPSGADIRVYFVGGATAVDRGWRSSTIDADLHASDDRLFTRIQEIKETLQVNIERVRPEDFVPALPDSESRHVFVTRIASVSFFHHDPYAQLLAKIVRGFRLDVEDAARFLDDGLVEADRFRTLVRGIGDEAYALYPNLSRQAVEAAVDDFLSGRA